MFCGFLLVLDMFSRFIVVEKINTVLMLFMNNCGMDIPCFVYPFQS